MCNILLLYSEHVNLQEYTSTPTTDIINYTDNMEQPYDNHTTTSYAPQIVGLEPDSELPEDSTLMEISDEPPAYWTLFIPGYTPVEEPPPTYEESQRL